MLICAPRYEDCCGCLHARFRVGVVNEGGCGCVFVGFRVALEGFVVVLVLVLVEMWLLVPVSQGCD
jgi:hypothetical protein